MKKLLLFSFAALSFSASAQTVFWTETFGTGCNQGTTAGSYTGPNGTWTVAASGTNDAQANQWFVSATEAGMAPGGCGDGCVNTPALTDATLHIGANDGITPTDAAASYNTGGLCGIGLCVISNWRAESPVIDCSGNSGLTLWFNYIENGDGANDDGSVWYYDGINWSLLINTPKTAPICPNGGGLWTAFSIALPASADNNPNVKIGFNWTNNDDATGTDPSFAVDSVRLSAATVTGINSTTAGSDVKVLYGNDNEIFISCDRPCKLVAVRDLLGREVSGTLYNNQLSINASRGLYMIELEVDGKRIFKEVVTGK